MLKSTTNNKKHKLITVLMIMGVFGTLSTSAKYVNNLTNIEVNKIYNSIYNNNKINKAIYVASITKSGKTYS